MTSVWIESTLDWSKTTFIDWTSFEMADEQLRLQLLVFIPGICDHLFTWHPCNVKKKCKLIKKHLGRGNFVLFSNSENIPLFLSLNKIHATKYMQGYRVYIKCFILTLFLFSLFASKPVEREILSQEFSFTDRFPLSLDTGPKMCYWWNLKSEGLKLLKSLRMPIPVYQQCLKLKA